jgi:hypothetical protein
MKHVMLACLVALGAAGCVTTSAEVKPKQAQLGASSAVKAAEEVISPLRPVADAESHLSGAKADIRRGQQMMARGEYQVAQLYFERAQEKAVTAKVQARAKQAEEKAATAQRETTAEGGRGS